MLRDPCSLLGVSKSASKREIRSAYLKLVRHHHPDRFTDFAKKRESEEFLKIINQAYKEALSSVEKTGAADLPVKRAFKQTNPEASDQNSSTKSAASIKKSFLPNIFFLIFLSAAWMTLLKNSLQSGYGVFYFAAFSAIPAITALWYNLTEKNVSGAKLSFVGATSLSFMFLILLTVMNHENSH